MDYYILHHHEWKYLFAAIIERICFGVTFCLVVTCILCYDALHISQKWKVLIASLLAINATIWSVWSVFIASNNDINTYDFVNYALIKVGPYIAISLTSLQISTMRILAIFLWRQTVCSHISPDQSILIMSKPHIRWIEQNDYKTAKQLREDNIISLVNIIGGVDEIISHYKQQQHIELNQNQLRKISQIITSNNKSSKLHEDSQIINGNKSSRFQRKEIYYYFRTNDSFLYTIFGANIEEKINKIFYSLIGKITFSSSLLVYIICRFAARFLDHDTPHFPIFLMIQIFIVGIIGIPYTIYFMLSFNKYAFKLIAKGFEFWLKLFYAVIYITTTSVNNLLINPSDVHPNLTKTWQILVGIWFTFAIVIVSSLDTIKLNRKWKLIILATSCIMVILWTSFLMFGSISNKDERDNSVVPITSEYAISLLMLQISGIRVVAIFFCKQLFSSLNKKNEAASITEIPTIKWKDE